MSGIPHDHYEPKTGAERWLHRRLPIVSIIYDTLMIPTPKNLNYWWTFGGILSMMLAAQILTGVVLASILILALRKSLQLMNVSGYTQGIAVGGVLIASLLVTNLSQRFFGAVRERRRPAAQLGADIT